MKKVYIFGGSFDPLHIAHIDIVKKISSFKADKIFIVPTFINRFKKDFFLKPKIRLKLLKKVFRGKKIKIIDYEIRQKKPTPTYKTVLFIKKTYRIKKIYVVIGADNLDLLNMWYNYKRLKNIVKFVVFKRGGVKIPKGYETIDFDYNVSSSYIKNNKALKYIPKQLRKGVAKYWKD